MVPHIRGAVTAALAFIGHHALSRGNKWQWKNLGIVSKYRT
jgi:hypothetical protein